ncbi:MAG: alanine racemase [Deltaproteobacteria bacterium]|nr:alanine racemase [Deltaproteobacteria bacterium]
MRVRPTEAEVDLAAIAGNYRLAVEVGGRHGVAVVKADAYGHGAVPVARALAAAGAPWLGVALVEEGLELRAANVQLPILVLAGAFGDAWDEVLRQRLTPVLTSAGQIAALGAAARAWRVRAEAHLELDTGMGRLGASPAELPGLVAALRANPEVSLTGLCTHFAGADTGDDEGSARQAVLFREAAEALAAEGLSPLLHATNSAATLRVPGVRQELSRPGILLYGYLSYGPELDAPAEARSAAARLQPALTWRTAVVHLKEVPAGTRISYGGHWTAARPSRIATLPVGYADGYDRRLSGRPGYGRAEVLVRGRRAPVVGTVCMDLVMVDVTDVPGVAPGDEVVLLGAQGSERIGADELARRAGTISYEILCGISRRVPRRYSPR